MAPIQYKPIIATTVLWLLCSVSGAAESVDPYKNYNGKYARDPRFKKVASRVMRYRKAALKTIQRRLGLSPQDVGDIRIVLKDAMVADEERIQRFYGPPFLTSRDDDDNVIVTLHTEFFVNRQYDLREELTHEMTHAVMRDQMADEDYNAVPKWLREGLALWTAGQIQSRVRIILRNTDVLRGKVHAFPGLETGTHSIYRYAEDVLAIEFIAHTKGEEAVIDLASAIVNGIPPHEAIEKVSGRSWKQFKSDCRRFSLEWQKDFRTPESAAYLRIVQQSKSRGYRAVKRESKSFLKRYPRSMFRGDVLYWRGKACRLLRKPSQAESALNELLRKHSLASGFLEEALLQLGRARLESGKYHAAMRPFKRILLDHPASSIHDRAVYYLALCRTKLGQKAEARRLLDVFDRSFPRSPMTGRVRELRKSLGKK